MYLKFVNNVFFVILISFQFKLMISITCINLIIFALLSNKTWKKQVKKRHICPHKNFIKAKI